MIPRAALAQTPAADVSDDHRYIVVFKDSVARPADVAHAQAEAEEGDIGFIYRSALKGYSVTLSDQGAEALEQDPRVAFVERDMLGTADAQTTPRGVRRTFATLNPNLAINSSDDMRVDADVAVIDSGIDQDHPDLDVFARVNCVPPGQDPNAQLCTNGAGNDGSGHGTHVAGTIGALDNSIGVVGAAPGVRLWAVKALTNDDTWWTAWGLAAIDWVTAHADQIEVANMSIGIPHSDALNEAIDGSIQEGIVYVASAGNAGGPVNRSPGDNADVITVSGLADYDGEPGGLGSPPSGCAKNGGDDKLQGDSNFGPLIDVAAPSVCIRSTEPGGSYELRTGTSMAAPHVAGAAAILASAGNPNSAADVGAIRQAIVTAGNLNWTDTSGDGVKEPLLDVHDPGTLNPRAATPTFSFAFGSQGSGPGQFESPTGIAVDSHGNVWVLDTGNQRLQKFDSDGDFLTQVGSQGSGPGQFDFAAGPGIEIAVDDEDNLWVPDPGNHRVQKFDPDGDFLTQFGSQGSGPGQFAYPPGVGGIAAGPQGNVWVLDTGNDRLQKFDSDGDFVTQFGSQAFGPGLAVDAQGNVWVADNRGFFGDSALLKYDPEGGPLAEVSAYLPQGVASDADGSTWVASFNSMVHRLDSQGTHLATIGDLGSGQGEFVIPQGVVVDDDGDVWVADTGNHRVQKWSR